MHENFLSEQMNCKETLTFLQLPHRDLQGNFLPGILPLRQKELIRKIAWLSY